MKKIREYFKNPGTVSNLLIVLAGIAFYLILQNISQIWHGFGRVLSVFKTLFGGALLAYLLVPFARFLSGRVFGKMKKRHAADVLGSVLAFAATILILALLVVEIVPQLAASLSTLISNLETYFKTLKTFLTGLEERFSFLTFDVDALLGTWSDIFTTVSQWLVNNVESIVGAGFKVGSGLFDVVLTFVFAIYVLLDRKNIRIAFRRLAAAALDEEKCLRLSELSRRAERIMTGYLGGSLLDSLIVGIVNFVAMAAFGLPYPLLISVIVAVTNIVPTFGPIAGAIPCLLIIVLVKPIDALWFLILTIVLQTIDGNVIKPLLFGNSTGLRPLEVLVAVVAGGGLFGIGGMILGIPVFAFLFSVIEERVDAKLEQKGIRDLPEMPPRPARRKPALKIKFASGKNKVKKEAADSRGEPPEKPKDTAGER